MWCGGGGGEAIYGGKFIRIVSMSCDNLLIIYEMV